MNTTRVLVVDDDPRILRLVQAKLQGGGIGSDTASSSEEGIERMRRDFYNVVVADINMPGMSGIEMVSALKECNPLVQVIMLTAEPTFIRVLECIDRGAVEFFSKSDDMAMLVDTVALCQKRVDRWTHLVEQRGEKVTTASV